MRACPPLIEVSAGISVGVESEEIEGKLEIEESVEELVGVVDFEESVQLGLEEVRICLCLVDLSVGVVEGEAKVELEGVALKVSIEVSIGTEEVADEVTAKLSAEEAEFEGEVVGVEANAEVSIVEVTFVELEVPAELERAGKSRFIDLSNAGVADADETTAKRAKIALMNFMALVE